MYVPEYFEVDDKAKIFAFIEANAFGQLISSVHGRPFSSHLPFLLSEDRSKLFAHVARQNPQFQEISGQEVLVTLQGHHDYISPSWYSSPGVPTWNYQAVHIYGMCQAFEEPNRLKQLVDRLTSKYESRLEDPWQPDYNANMLKAIVGIEITISEVQGKFKLSQNRSSDDQKRVIEKLKESDSLAMAEAMQKNAR